MKYDLNNPREIHPINYLINYGVIFFFCLTVFFYNFGMSDFGVSSLEGMVDAVKVLAFSVQEGKVAVHCHAGLGRTGKLQLLYHYFQCKFSDILFSLISILLYRCSYRMLSSLHLSDQR